MVKTIKIEKDDSEYKEYFNGNLPSKSFTKKLCSSVTVQLRSMIKDTRHKENFTEMLVLRYGYNCVFNPARYDASKRALIHIGIDAKNYACRFAEGCVIWRTQKADLADATYPWSDVSGVDLFFRLMVSPSEVRRLNYGIAELPLPTYKSKDTGLPYDFQIKNMELDGTLVIQTKNELTADDIIEFNKTLYDFFDKYNENHEEKIHYIGDFEIKRGNACVDVDAGTTDIKAIEECIACFSKFDFIKKIVFK